MNWRIDRGHPQSTLVTCVSYQLSVNWSIGKNELFRTPPNFGKNSCSSFNCIAVFNAMSSSLLTQICICHIHAIQGIVATIQPIWPMHRLWFRLVWDFKKQHHQHHVPQRRRVLSLTLPMITTPSTPTTYLYGMAAQPGTSAVNHKNEKQNDKIFFQE